MYNYFLQTLHNIVLPLDNVFYATPLTAQLPHTNNLRVFSYKTASSRCPDGIVCECARCFKSRCARCLKRGARASYIPLYRVQRANNNGKKRKTTNQQNKNWDPRSWLRKCMRNLLCLLYICMSHESRRDKRSGGGSEVATAWIERPLSTLFTIHTVYKLADSVYIYIV